MYEVLADCVAQNFRL